MLLLDLLIPARCAGCGARGAPCCARCAGVWSSVSEVVRVPVAGVARVFALARYRGVARRLLIAYKERGRRDLAASLGRALAEAVVVLPLRTAVSAGVRNPVSSGTSATSFAGEAGTASASRKICLVPAPSRRSAARVRGGPHVERLANAAASVLAGWGFEVAVAPALELTGGARDAVGLDRAERVANLAGRLRFREAGRPPPGFPVVVLDDVITTGATAAACVRALEGEGIEVAAVLTLLAAG
ncbi:ComF family protein [Amycolatopsis sp. NPDC051371]|uniref:ComF family protein n=1 Tax=Amycolatopsis sp. NPDC051371 TaxID=3155800 RepID=UPI003426B46A